MPLWREVCGSCGRTWELEQQRWRCSCGGLLDLVGPRADPWSGPHSGSADTPLSRYAPALPPGAGDLHLGLWVTPVERIGPGVHLKCDHLQPTGSFKDRGAAVMIGVAARMGVTSVLLDSSGNAGKAAAAHAAAASMACTVLVPAGTDGAKIGAMGRYGAEVVVVPGDRAATSRAAEEALAHAGRGGTPWYASHVHQPLFHHGVKTLAFELAEQVPGLEQGVVVVPAGNGTLVLGLWLGFSDLVAAGRLPGMPRLVAVQAESCAPLAGRPVVHPATAATGIAVAHPPRARQVRAAVAATGGGVLTVGEDDIAAARDRLEDLGLTVEATGAVGFAALDGPTGDARPLVVVLTG